MTGRPSPASHVGASDYHNPRTRHQDSYDVNRHAMFKTTSSTRPGRESSRVKQQSPTVRSDAVGYLRVSSLGQVETDFDPEGISLPAQRKAITSRAKELGAVLVTEFTDPGKSAKSIEKRDAFREMIAYLKANPNIRYVIVYALSRFARNRYDDAIMMMTLEKLGMTLISATEKNLDASPAGRAMHGMIAVFNEYQVLTGFYPSPTRHVVVGLVVGGSGRAV
jgi:resolvase-like protein